MKITKLSCTACGAPISIPEDLDQITCTACGTGLIIERGEGYVALKLAEKIARSIEITGIQTQNAIHENTTVTREELQRLQISQEVSSLQMQLNGVQTELRMLRRDVNNVMAKKPLSNLEKQEFQVMEQIRSLKKQAFSPNPSNLRASINFFEWESAWLEAEMVALNDGNLPQRGQLFLQLQNQRVNSNASLAALRTAELKMRFPSFSMPDPPSDNVDEILKVLAKVDNDEGGCRQYLGLPEGREVHHQLVQRQKSLRQKADQLELARLQRNLLSLNMEPNPNDGASLVAYLNQLDSDIQVLERASASNPINELRNQLYKSRNASIKQLNSINKANSHSTTVETTPAFLPRIGAATTGIFTGIGLFFAGIMSWLAKPTKTTASSGQREKNSQPNVLNTYQQDKKRKSVAHPTLGGFLIWIFSLIASLLIGFGLFATINVNTAPNGFTISILVASVTIGYILGAKAFLRRASASIKVEGKGNMKDMFIRTRNPGKGIRNEKAIKFWVGLIVFISMLLFGLFAGVLVAEKSPAIMVLILLSSIIAAIAFGILAAKRTTFLSPTDTE